MELDTTMSIDLQEVKKLITSDKFAQFLLSNTDFPEAAFVLHVLNEEIEKHGVTIDD